MIWATEIKKCTWKVQKAWVVTCEEGVGYGRMQRLTVVSSIAPSAAAASVAVISAHSRQASKLTPHKISSFRLHIVASLSSYPQHIVASSWPEEIQCTA